LAGISEKGYSKQRFLASDIWVCMGSVRWSS